MELQIDLKPKWSVDEGASFTMNLWINGRAIPAHITYNDAQDLVRAGILKKVTGHRRTESGEIVEFEYENGVDSTGVAYTSKAFELMPLD